MSAPDGGGLTAEEREALDRVTAYVEAVPTLYDDEDPMPEGLTLDTATDWSVETRIDGFKIVAAPHHDLTLADLRAVLSLAATAGNLLADKRVISALVTKNRLRAEAAEQRAERLTAAVEALRDEWRGITGDNTSAVEQWHASADMLDAVLAAPNLYEQQYARVAYKVEQAEQRAERVTAAVEALADEWERLAAGDDEFGLPSALPVWNAADRLRAVLAAPNQYEQQYARVADVVEQAEHDAEVAASALREAASDIVADCSNQPGPCICVARDWLRDRAAALAPDAADTTDGGDTQMTDTTVHTAGRAHRLVGAHYGWVRCSCDPTRLLSMEEFNRHLEGGQDAVRQGNADQEG